MLSGSFPVRCMIEVPTCCCRSTHLSMFIPHVHRMHLSLLLRCMIEVPTGCCRSTHLSMFLPHPPDAPLSAAGYSKPKRHHGERALTHPFRPTQSTHPRRFDRRLLRFTRSGSRSCTPTSSGRIENPSTRRRSPAGAPQIIPRGRGSAGVRFRVRRSTPPRSRRRS